MRILNTKTFELHTDDQEDFRYDPNSKTSPQLDKIRKACQTAREQGLSWLWMDTCCINKESAVEETESINSMFKWYRGAEICLTYLHDVPEKVSEGRGVFLRNDGTVSEWFRRGWTLQEFLAPKAMQFYNCHSKFLGTKRELACEIAAITQIDVSYLTGESSFRNASIAQKMSWMAGRTTTRIEDMAYSLVGVFDTYIVPQYGEGQRAFVRLEKELLSSIADESIFTWTAPSNSWPDHQRSVDWCEDEWGLLAPSPDCFKDSHDIHLGGKGQQRVTGAFAVTPTGVLFPVPINHFYKKSVLRGMAVVPFAGPVAAIIYKTKGQRRKAISVALNCWRNDAHGRAQPIKIRLRKTDSGQWIRYECTGLGVADQVQASGRRTGVGLPNVPNFMQCIVVQPTIEA